jgi:hypothetical protein
VGGGPSWEVRPTALPLRLHHPCDRLGSAMNDIVSCPACALPASVADRFSLASTDGPIEHVRVSCAGGHTLVQLADQVVHLSLVDPSVGEISDPGQRAAHRR